MKYYTYILKCKDETLYIGATNNLEKRFHEHNNSKQGAHYTKIRRPVVLQYFEEFETLGESRKREAEVKRMRRVEKIELIASVKARARRRIEKIAQTKYKLSIKKGNNKGK